MLNNPNNSENDLSLVLMLNYFHNKILFTGDIEKLGENSLIKDLKQADFFKGTPHHGVRLLHQRDFLMW